MGWLQPQLQASLKEGWEYATSFTSKFHVEEKKSDFVRRRRWVRYIKPLAQQAPSSPCFQVTLEVRYCALRYSTLCIALHSFLHVHSASLELDHSDQTSAHGSSILSYSQDKRTIIFAPSVCVDYTSTHIVLNMMLY